MTRTAILVDGDYYLRRSNGLWGRKSPSERAKQASQLDEGDFVLVGLKQTGVDMRIGLDVASLGTSKLVNQIVLVAGDSDFIPVAKAARKAGI